jgi:hypothetical protein
MIDETETNNKKSFTEWVRNQNAGLWFGILFLAYSILFFKMSFDIPYHSKLGAGPGMYPRWLSGFSIFIALVYVWQSCTKQVFKAGLCFPGKQELINVASVFISCLVFLFLLNIVGFNIAGSLLMFVVLVRQYRLWPAIVLSIAITFIHYFIFKVCFSVPLPEKFLSLFGF